MLWPIFAAVLAIAKIMALRRRVRAWNAVRVAVATLGLAAMASGLGAKSSVGAILAGAVVVFFALLIAPEPSRRSVDERARELGALVVLDGGRCCTPREEPFEARLFLGSDRIWVLDQDLRLMFGFPLAQLRTLGTQPAGKGWKLCLADNQSAAEFLYEGTFR